MLMHVSEAFGAKSMAEIESHVANAHKSADVLKAEMDKAASVVARQGINASVLAKETERLVASATRVLTVLREAGKIKATVLSTTEAQQAQNAAYDALKGYDHVLTDASRKATLAAIEEAAFAKSLLVTVLLAATVLGVAAALYMAHTLSQGLQQAVRLADAVAVGDLSQTVAVKSQDELGDLTKALNAMTVNLSATAQIADSIAAGDLTVEARRHSDKDKLGIALENMVAKLRGVATQVAVAAQNVSAGSEQLAASAEQLSQGSTEQAASTEEASASMEEMAANVKQTADNAMTTEQMAARSARDAEASGVAVGKAVEAMQTIAAKINIVQEIARQTDLLGAQRGGGSGPRRRAWPRLRGGRLRGAQACGAQPVGRGRDRRAVGRDGEGRARSRRDAVAARAGYPQDGGAGRGDHGGLPRAGCRRLADQHGDPAARQGHAAECLGLRGGLLDLHRTQHTGAAAGVGRGLLPRASGELRRFAAAGEASAALIDAAVEQLRARAQTMSAPAPAHSSAGSMPALQVANGGFNFDLRGAGDSQDAAFRRN